MAGTTVMELNQQRDVSFLTKSTRQHELLTDQIAVDHNNSSDVKHAPKCNHFSIRGFVAEVRKRDPNLCDPFSPHGGLHDSIKEPQHVLPPMEVPNFRWWKCVGCVPEAAEGAPNGTANEEAPLISADLDVVDALIPSTGQTSNPPKRRTSDASTSTDSNDNRNMPPTVLSADPKGKGKAHAEDALPPPTGYKNGVLVENPLRQAINLTQTFDAVKFRTAANDDVVVRPRCNENALTEYHLEDCRINRGEIKAPEDYVNREVNDIADETCGAKSHGCLDAQPGDVLTNIGAITDKVAEIGDGPSSDGKGHSSVALPDLNECSGEPPYGSGDNDDDDNNDDDDDDDDDDDNDNDDEKNNTNRFVIPGVLCEDDDDYLGADRRKIPKVRLLSDLLGLTGNNSDPKAKKKNPSSSVSPPGVATCKNLASDSQAQLPMNENAKRKRTAGSQDEESSKSMEIRGLSNGNKRLRMLYETSESESEDKSSDQIMIPETTTKRRGKLSKSPFVEKKAKRIKIDSGASCSVSRKRTILPRSSHEKGKSSEKPPVSPDAVITEKALHNVNSDMMTDLPPMGNVSAPMSERNSGMLINKKAKIPRSGKPTCKNHVPRDCSAVRNSDETIQKRTEYIQSEQIRQDESIHFPKSYSPVGNGHIRIPIPVKDGFHSLPPWAEPMVLEGHFSKKTSENRSIGETSSAFRPPLTTRAIGNGERISISTTNSKGKHAWVPEAQESGGPRVQQREKQVCDSVANQKEVTTEVRGRQDIDINSIPTEDRVSEQGTVDRDDIPMEIVELLAKNQYERNLRDPKDHQPYPITLTNYGKNVRSNGNGYGENVPMFWQSHMLGMPKPLAIDSRNGMVNRFDEMGPTKQQMFGPFSDYNHRNHVSIRGDFRENPMSSRSLSPQGQEHIPPYHHGGGYSMGKQRSPPSFLHEMESYNTLRGSSSSPRPNIETRAWPPMMSRRMPMGITNPDMMSSLNKGRAHNHPSQRPTILNFNLGKQSSMGFSNGYSNYCGTPESSVSGKSRGSADLYSNEAISAMHLLSLMQHAAKSQPSVPLSMDGKPGGMLKRSMVPPDQQQYKQHQNNNHNQEIGPQKTGASSSNPRQPLLENQGRTTSLQGGNHPCYPNAGFAFSSSLQNNNRGMGRNSGFISPIPLTSKGQRSIESSHFSNPRHLSSPSLDKGKGIMGTSHPNSPNNLFGLGTKRDERTILKAPQTEICVVSRNPSEFNDLTELRKYMIGPDDLKPKKIGRGKPGRPRGDGKKQENQNRMVKKHIHNHTVKEARKC